jgi:hypothetical protein
MRRDWAPYKFSLTDLFLCFAVLGNLAIAVAIPNIASTILATLLYLVALTRVFKKSPLGFLLFSPIIFLHFTALISINAIESGAYMKEMGRVGYESAASATWAIIAIMFIAVATSVFSSGSGQSNEPSAKLNVQRHAFIGTWVAPLVVSVFILWLILKGVTSGFPLIDGIDRFAYRRAVGDPLTLNILNLKIVIAAFVGLSAANCSTRIGQYSHHGVFIAYLLTSFLFGDKFFIIVSSSLYYVAVQLAFHPEIIDRQAKRFFFPALVSLLAAIAMTVYIYSGQGTYSADKTFDLLLNRFAAQGQLWFIAFNENFHWVTFDTHSALDNIRSLVENPHQDYVFEKRLSAFHFIETYAPSKMFLSFIGNQGFVAPVGVFEAYMLELFGFIGCLVFVTLAGGMLGYIARYIRYAIFSGNPFTILLPAYLLVQFYYLIAAGTFYNVFGTSAFKAYLAFALLQSAVSYWIRRTTLRFDKQRKEAATRNFLNPLLKEPQ